MKQARRRSDIRGDAHTAAQQMPINVPSHNQQITSLLNPSAPVSSSRVAAGVPSAAIPTLNPQGVALRNNANASSRTPALSVQPPHNVFIPPPSRASTVNASSASRKSSTPGDRSSIGYFSTFVVSGRVPLSNFRGGPIQQQTQQQQRFVPAAE